MLSVALTSTSAANCCGRNWQIGIFGNKTEVISVNGTTGDCNIRLTAYAAFADTAANSCTGGGNHGRNSAAVNGNNTVTVTATSNRGTVVFNLCTGENITAVYYDSF